MPISPNGTAFDLDGPADAPVVVLIHGLGLTRAIWRDHIPGYAQKFRVLSYDLCGHGDSALPHRTPALSVLAAQLVDLLDHLEIPRAALVGFSLGGMINRRFAINHPDRVWALVIQNSPHLRDPGLQQQVEDAARVAGSGGPAATIEAALARWFTPGFLAREPNTVAWVRRTVLANDPDNYAGHRFVLAAGVRELVRPAPAIAQPVLVMTSEHDAGSTPAMAKAIAQETKGAELQIVAGLKHMGVLENPNAFSAPAIAFLSLRTPG